MHTLKLFVGHLAIVGMCAIAGCVQARGTEDQGSSKFVGGLPIASLDYGPAGQGGMGGGAGGTASASAGMDSPHISMAGIGGAAGMITGGAGGDGASDAGGGAGTSGSAGMEATGGASGAAGSGPGAVGTLKLAFMSVGNDGEYAPRNIGAVWIETSSGMFVKTIERWAGIRAGHLTTWTAASGGWGGGFFFPTGGNAADQLDVISSATQRPHMMHSPTWNMKNTMGAIVPDGMYRVRIEVTESERKASSVASIEFVKGPAPVSLSPADEGPFKDLTLSYTP